MPRQPRFDVSRPTAFDVNLFLVLMRSQPQGENALWGD